MCKCTGPALYWTSNQQSFPYCYNGNYCKPSEKWFNKSKGCPWKIYKKLYVKEKTPLCLATGANRSLTHAWSSGNFSEHFCSEENCGSYHFNKEK